MASVDGPGHRGRDVVVLFLRLGIGLGLFLPLGVGKLMNYPGSAARMVENFSQGLLGHLPLLPFLYAFAYALGFWETLGGALLTLGWRTRQVFLAMSLLLVLLTFGANLGLGIETVFRNVVFLVVCLWGYLWADADRYGISGWRS